MCKSGIYKIICLINGKFYIGSTRDTHIRWQEHQSCLRRNVHGNPYLQNSWNKYGRDEFIFQVIERVAQEDLISREQFWMDKTKCYLRSVGFNVAREALTIDGMLEHNRKRYIITFPDGEERRIKGLATFCREHNLNAAAMSQVALGNVNQHKGYLCRHHGVTQAQWEKSKRRNYKSGGGWKGHWLITTPTGEKMIVPSLTQFCKEHDLNQGNMSSVANGERKHDRGYKCSRYENSTK